MTDAAKTSHSRGEASVSRSIAVVLLLLSGLELVLLGIIIALWLNGNGPVESLANLFGGPDVFSVMLIMSLFVILAFARMSFDRLFCHPDGRRAPPASAGDRPAGVDALHETDETGPSNLPHLRRTRRRAKLVGRCLLPLCFAAPLWLPALPQGLDAGVSVRSVAVLLVGVVVVSHAMIMLSLDLRIARASAA